MNKQAKSGVGSGLYVGSGFSRTLSVLLLMTAVAAPAAAQTIVPKDYRVLATNRTGTMQNELHEAGEQGYEVVGMTVADTAFRGKELVTITRRRRQ